MHPTLLISRLACITGVAGFIFTHAGADGADWPRWRGPNDDGAASAGRYAVHWNSSNALWKIALPGKGCSTPVVIGGKIVLTAPLEGKDAVLAFDLQGKPLWQTAFGSERAGKHRNGSGSNASPITDGRSVFVYFKSGTLAALELDGTIRWQTNLVEAFGPDTLYWDHGTSPVLTEKYVVMTRMHKGESWLAGFDQQTGAMVWKEARNYQTPDENDHGYATPLVMRHAGREALLLWGGEHLTIHDTANGKLVWSAEGFNPAGGKNYPSIASPVVISNACVVANGRNERGAPLLFGVDLAGPGGTNHLWARRDTGTFIPTPAVREGKFILLRDRGEVECLDPRTGETLWKGAFPRSSANFYASPLVADGKLYAVREDGMFFVAGLTGNFEVLAENNMGERVIASPVAVDGRLLIRGEKNLFCYVEP